MARAGKLTRWQGGAAMAVGLAVAGAPIPAMPLAVDDAMTPARVDDADTGAAEALVVATVLHRNRRGDSISAEIIVT